MYTLNQLVWLKSPLMETSKHKYILRAATVISKEGSMWLGYVPELDHYFRFNDRGLVYHFDVPETTGEAVVIPGPNNILEKPRYE